MDVGGGLMIFVTIVFLLLLLYRIPPAQVGSGLPKFIKGMFGGDKYHSLLYVILFIIIVASITQID